MDLDTPLHHLRAICPEVVAAAVVGGDGALLATHADAEHAEVIGPVVTTLGGLSERAVQELGRGGLELAVLNGTNGYVVLADLGRGRVLAVVAERAARLGLLLDDVHVCAGTVRQSLEREVAHA